VTESPIVRTRRTARHTHSEPHSNAGDAVRDIIIGMSDGLTVPFALAAGISGAIAASHIVVTAGIAELAAGGISMGLGGYLAARSDLEHYASEQQREYQETDDVPEEERREIEQIFASYGISGEPLRQLVNTVTADKKRWVDFMMRFELGLEQPNPAAAPRSAMRIGGSYVVGGLIPLTPYMVLPTTQLGLIWSAIVTFIALVLFGSVKGHFTGVSIWKSALQTSCIGAIAAGVAFLLARLVNGAPV
jgi:VIT1/CCC1 family predicted Fe2+/Mn2+ transporter